MKVDAKTRPVLAQADCPRWLRIARSPWSFLVVAALPASLAIHGILTLNGGAPAVPLDDSYIHFQFARSFAHGQPFVYSPGTAPVPGATSLLWPLLLALPQLFGVKGLDLIPWAWAFGFVSLGLLAYESARAAEHITSPRMAWLAGVLVLSFSANTWFAASGMEVVPLAWLLMRCARRAAEWLEGDRRRLGELLLLALLTPLMRPEGALGSVLIGAALFIADSGARRAFGLAALTGIAVPPAIYRVFTGYATQTTTLVKWLPFSPYLDLQQLVAQVLSNVRLLLSTLLDGQLWSAAYLPEHSRVLAWLALPALIVAGTIRRTSWRAWLLVALGLGMFLPTTYDSFLWNRLRYLWPFAGPWLIGIVALADLAGELAAPWRPRAGLVRYGLVAAVGYALVGKFSFALEDLAVSAHAISSQQAELGSWARDSLEPEERLGVSDTGAIGYLSNHTLFDVVGLTTVGEARYWSAGAGSRFEHYEHLPRRALPTFFIVYPEWFAIPQLLGVCVQERTVHATILGGETMVACHADYAKLGSGEDAQASEFRQRPALDALDVADLESESAHSYIVRPAAQADDVVLSDGVLVDGARRNRRLDRFRIELAPGATFVSRLGSECPTRLSLRMNGRLLESWTVSRPDFEEHALTLPADIPRGPAELVVSTEGPAFSAAHYWVYAAAK